jgi:ribonuclease Z
MRWETIDELEIYGGKWALERIRDLLFGVVLRGARPPMAIRLVEIQPGEFLKGEDFSVSAFPVYHRGSDSYGFLFEEKARRPFLPQAAEALNIPPGPWRRELVNGQSVRLPDGRVITPQQVLGEERPGIRLVLVGDSGRTDNLGEVCRSADALVIEATYLEEEADMAERFSHLTARQAAELAAQAGAKNLILTHVSRRYREREVLAEARALFPGAILARDFDVFQIKRGECVRMEERENGEA